MAWERSTPRPTPTGWQRIRRIVYRRDRGHCRICGQPAGTGWQVDHIIPVAEGGSDELENLQLVGGDCDCHLIKTKRETRRGQRRHSARRPRPPHPGLIAPSARREG